MIAFVLSRPSMVLQCYDVVQRDTHRCEDTAVALAVLARESYLLERRSSDGEVKPIRPERTVNNSWHQPCLAAQSARAALDTFLLRDDACVRERMAIGYPTPVVAVFNLCFLQCPLFHLQYAYSTRSFCICMHSPFAYFELVRYQV
jgi:hypothetical protein